MFEPSLHFLADSHHLIDWGSGSLALMPGGSTRFTNPVLRSFSGLVGQGLAVLFGQKAGFAFTGHLSTLLKEQGIQMAGPRGRQLPVADFVLEDRAGGRCLMEARGSFTRSGNCPKKAKATLKTALSRQVTPWVTRVAPPVTKGFATVAYLREPSAADPSSFVFAAPEGDEEPGSVDMDSDLLRRYSYAGWLRAMGLYGLAELLETPSERPEKVILFDVANVAGRDIAFPSPWQDWWHPVAWMRYEAWWHFKTYLRSAPDTLQRWTPLIAGLDLGIVRLLADRTRGLHWRLADFPAIEPPISSSENEGFPYSVFADGTFMGILGEREFDDLRVERVCF